MCYSARTKKNLDQAAARFLASVDLESFVRLYQLRAQDPSIKIPDGMEEYFIKKGGTSGRSILNSIKVFENQEKAQNKELLKTLEQEIQELEQRLKIKVTKTHQKSLEAKKRKREKLLDKAKKATQQDEDSESFRIYPYYFAPVIAAAGNKRIITPMRYRILPRSGQEIPNQYNVFNARRDSLTEARTWKQLFGEQHAIFPFLKFYEWVEDEKNQKVELSFSPNDRDEMWAASLFEGYRDKTHNTIIRSFAMVTDDPPPEVAAAGHDRCPVFLSENLIEDWLHPEKKDLKKLDELLDHKEQTYYDHKIAI